MIQELENYLINAIVNIGHSEEYAIMRVKAMQNSGELKYIEEDYHYWISKFS